MTKILLIIVLLTTAMRSHAQELEPFINFLRSTPAYINGEASFVADSVLYEEGWTIVKIVKGQPIEFSFQENWLQVRPVNAFSVKYAGVRVYIDSVTWTPSGVKTQSRVPVDFTGLSRSYVSSEVAKIIETLFGEKLKRANRILSSVRNQRSIGNIFDKALNMVHIFTTGEGPGVSLPNYRGEIGLNFLPQVNKGFDLYGTRVTIKAHDHYRSGFSFTGDNNGIYPYRLQFTSRDGTDINKGREWKALARLILGQVTLDAQGIDLKMNLGASQIISALCPSCTESSQFPGIRLQVEAYVRASMMEQVKAIWSLLPGLNISQNTLNAFTRREKCRENNLACLQRAARQPVPVKQCTQTYRTCMK